MAQINGDLRQVDSEIFYFDDQNKRHQQAQTQLTKALEYEMHRVKEQSVADSDVRIKLQSRESELRHL